MSKFKLVCGVGFNDRKYKTTLDGKITREYDTWSSMLKRCYSESYLKRFPSYRGKTVCEEWLIYSNFHKWMVDYPYNKYNWHLDKDILVKGNTVYSPETCTFLPEAINLLLGKSTRRRGKYPIGVCSVRRRKRTKYMAQCYDSAGKRSCRYFSSADEAFAWYKESKERAVREVADLYKGVIDPRAYEALVNYTVEITD